MKGLFKASMILAGLLLAIPAFAQDLWNPATGVWILQKGDLYKGDTAAGDLYYTRYNGDVTDRVKRISFRYNGFGWFRIVDKDTIAYTNGADGIIHHPDGDLLVGGQGKNVYKVNKASKSVVRTVTDSTAKASKFGIYHLMMDPSNSILWAAGIPGYLFKFSTLDNVAQKNLGNGAWVRVTGSDTTICTLAWDETGKAFYTSSSWDGKGVFGTIDMKTMKTTRIITDSIYGPHGMSYDEYSKTIFLYGGSHIIQVDPVSGKIIANLDFGTTAMFKNSGHGFRFDQGTTDGEGHLYVADNNGYLVFIDFTSNPNKRIDDNVLIHAQFLDTELDDVAPLSGAGSEKKKTTTSSGSGLSSSSVSSSSNQVVVLSSSRQASSSGTTGGTSSGGGTGNSSGATGTSSGATGTSSGATGTSSGATGTSSGATGTSSGATGTSSGTTGTSSGATSSGANTSSGASSAGGTGNSVPGGGSSSAGGSGTSVPGGGTSSAGGSGEDIPPWADPSWDWGTGEDVPAEGTPDNYPTADKREIADSVVSAGGELVPVDPSKYDPSQLITIGGNSYLKNGTGDPLTGFKPGVGTTGGRDSVPLGSVLNLTLDLNKLKDYFGPSADKLVIQGSDGLNFLNPSKGGTPTDSLVIPLDGSTKNIWVTSDTTLAGGYITITGPDGKVLLYDGINFYDPIPFPEAGLLKDTNGDLKKDEIEVFLDRPLDATYSVKSVDILYNGKTLTVNASDITLNQDRDRITINVKGSGLESYTVKASDILKIHFTDKAGRNYDRQMPLKEVVQGIIARAVVIRSLTGRDSLFVEFNLDITPLDLAQKNSLILLNHKVISVDLARQPGKRLVILEADDYTWTGLDSIQIHELVSFENLPFIVEEEYSRMVPVDIITRVPALVTGSGYYDADGDGAMDSVVFQFGDTVTQAQLDMMHFTIPWYSYRNRQIQLMPQPSDLVIDPNDPTKVYWNVQSNVDLRVGMTSLPAGLPPTEIYIEYPIFNSTFTEHRTFPLDDYMAPSIVDARIKFSEYGDTLKVQFSEKVDFANVNRKDVFKYVHGGKTIILRPQDLLWAKDGMSVDILLPTNQKDPVLPGDFLIIRGDMEGEGSMVVDGLGNVPLGDTEGFLIQGGLNQVVQTSNMGNLTKARMDSTKALSAMSVQFVPQDKRASDLRDEGKVGQLIELGQRFLPQLVEQSGVSADSLDPKKVSIAISTYYFDNQGQYVTDTIIVLDCTNPSFGGNCLNTDKKIFIDWNFKDSRGRFVGTGVYVANYTLFIRYDEAKAVKEEKMEKVGVRRRQ